MATQAQLIAKLSLDMADFRKEMREAIGQVKELGEKAKKGGKDVEEGLDKAKKSTDGFGKSMKDLKGLIAGVFTADILMQFGKAVVNTTAEFQKMEAVLTNTLGSGSAAKIAMDQIVNFAQKTPFQVAELTDAFVKLANRGFVPTMKQMTSMGDLASSVGKSFDQLAEAILDAQSGEFERLKEFGIKSQVAGDNVIFTFKGIQTEVQKSDKAIQDYLISLGQMKGVAGAMESISKTTGGAISNLQDNIVGFFKDIGDSSTGFINWFIKDLNRAITSIRYFSETLEGLNPFTDISEKSEEFRKFLLKTSEATTDAGMAFKDFAASFDKVDIKKILGDNRFRELFIQSLVKEGQSLKEAESLWGTYVTLRKEAFDAEQKLNSVKQESIKTDDLANQKAEERVKALKKLREEQKLFLKETQSAPRSNPFEKGTFSQILDPKITEKQIKGVAEISKKIFEPITKGLTVILPTDIKERINSSYETAVLLTEQQKQFNKEMSIASTLTGMLGSTFQSAFEGMLNTGKISFKGIIDGLKALLIKLIAAAAAAFALSAILGGIGLGSFSLKGGGFMAGFKEIFSAMSGLPKFAKGGMVTGLTMAVLGDNPSGKEAVIPFEKMGSFLSQYGTGAQNITVDVVGKISGQDIYFSGLNYTNSRNKIIGG
jgi:hypothetical protein